MNLKDFFAGIFFTEDLPNQLICVHDSRDQIVFQNRAFRNYLANASLPFKDFISQTNQTLAISDPVQATDNRNFMQAEMTCSGFKAFAQSAILGEEHRFIKINIQNGFPALSRLIRYFLHDMRTPLSTAVMAVSNMNFILGNESDALSQEITEFTTTAQEALDEIRFPLDTIHQLARGLSRHHHETNLVMLLESFLTTTALRIQFDNRLGDMRPLINIDQGILSLALRYLFLFCEQIAPDSPLQFQLSKSGSHILFIIKNQLKKKDAGMKSVQPFINYHVLKEKIKKILAAIEMLLYPHDASISGTIDPNSSQFSLVIRFLEEFSAK